MEGMQIILRRILTDGTKFRKLATHVVETQMVWPLSLKLPEDTTPLQSYCVDTVAYFVSNVESLD